MAASMANWFGDGNGYVGDVNLDKETAHTFAYAAVFHDADKQLWNVHFKPYLLLILMTILMLKKCPITSRCSKDRWFQNTDP